MLSGPTSIVSAPFDIDASDAFLLACMLQRDEAALAIIYDRYRRLVYAIALRITNDSMVAEEVLQDVFHDVWQSVGMFEAGRNVAAWLVAIARHRAIDATRSRTYRARFHEQGLDLAMNDPLLHDTEIESERMFWDETVRCALATLPPAQQTALALAYFYGLTHTQIAASQHIPLGTVKTRIHLGLRKLRVLLHFNPIADGMSVGRRNAGEGA